MSTRKLLGGSQATEGKRRRKRALAELTRMAQMYAPGTPQRFRVESRLEALRETARRPDLTDAEKDASFTAILKRGV